MSHSRYLETLATYLDDILRMSDLMDHNQLALYMLQIFAILILIFSMVLHHYIVWPNF